MRSSRHILLLASAALLLAVPFARLAALELGAPFGDRMVLQRERPVVVWGSAAPGRTVTLRLADHEAVAEADDHGRWRAELPALAAGGPHELWVGDGATSTRLRDVLVGEVWLCSGQSNMEWSVAGSDHAEDNRAAAESLPRVRRLWVENVPSAREAETAVATWQPATAGVGDWSAVAFEAARVLHRELDVPIGIIQADWGGTRIEAWMPAAAVDDDADFAAAVAADEEGPRHDLAMAQAASTPVTAVRRMLAAGGQYPRDPGRQANSRDWERPEFDDDKWASMALPQLWESANLDLDGVLWFRRTVDIPRAWKGQDLVIELGAIDDCDHTWFDGHLVGQTGVDVPGHWRTPRRYVVPGKRVRPGERSIAIRVWDHYGAGGFSGKPEQMRIHPDGSEDQARSLAGDWRWKIELALPERAFDPSSARNQTTVLYNGMIAPLTPFALRGVLWYQGESNAGSPGVYAQRFPIMIKRWREAFEDEDLPFCFVQLPRYGEDSGDPAGNSWAWIREAQAAASALPGVHMAVTIDLGEPKDVHPRAKRPVGRRLAALALHEVHGRDDVAAHGPRFAALVQAEGKPLRVRFDHAEGLTTTDGEAPRGFHLAGPDRRWHPATAEIDGQSVILRHPQVTEPVAVRYAWTAFPEVNLVDANGLPAAPFRSDDW